MPLQGEEVDHEAEEVLNEFNLLTASEADGGGQGDEYAVGGKLRYTLFLVNKEILKEILSHIPHCTALFITN